MLDRGISLDSAVEPDRIKLSRGTRLHTGKSQDELCYYSPGARVPRGPWRHPFDVEWKLLTAGPYRWPNVVGIVTPQVSDKVREMLLLEAQRVEIGHKAQKMETIKEFAWEVWKPFANKSSIIRCLGFSIRAPGQTTTTVGQKGARIGLHVDSWFNAKADRRDSAANRLCLNLGRSSRTLLFINISLSSIVRILKDRGLEPPLNSPSQVGRLFMQVFPNYPVVSLDIRPGEAYLAPTENIIHDSSTKRRRALDITLTFLGHFRASSTKTTVSNT
jgi:hypothetical protein